MSKISTNLVKFAKQKSIPALVMDVVGKTCTIILSGRGKVLHNVPFIGPSPTVGDSVVVNYTSGRPIVEAGAKAIISTTASAALARPSATPAEGGRSSYHNDLKGIQGGVEATEADPAEFYHLTLAEYEALGGGAGHEIWDSDEAFDPEPILQFTGSGVTITDDPGVKTTVNIEGGAGDAADLTYTPAVNAD